MMKRAVLILVMATLWLAEGLFCFCPTEKATFAVCQSDGCTDEPSSPVSDTGNKDCGLCCGHFLFTSGNFESIEHILIQQEFSLQDLVFSNQFSFRSIYHPPKA
jgi:hypothetical protein